MVLNGTIVALNAVLSRGTRLRVKDRIRMGACSHQCASDGFGG